MYLTTNQSDKIQILYFGNTPFFSPHGTLFSSHETIFFILRDYFFRLTGLFYLPYGRDLPASQTDIHKPPSKPPRRKSSCQKYPSLQLFPNGMESLSQLYDTPFRKRRTQVSI